MKLNVLIIGNCYGDYQKLEILIHNLFTNLKIEYNLTIYTQKYSFFDKIQSIDILFLDMEFEGIDGIRLGKRIKELNPKCRIIIISLFSKYLIDGYKIHAERYFLKPINVNEFDVEMKKVIKEYYKQFVSFFDKNICSIPLYLKNIVYIEALDKLSIIHMSNHKIINTPYRFKYWVEKLTNDNFAQSHKSFYVNLSYVVDLERSEILLLTGERLYVSRHYRKSFEKAFLEIFYNNL